MQDLTSLFDFSTPVAGVYPIARVGATDAAFYLLEEIRQRYGPVTFHHTGGAFDGSEPLCLPKGELALGHRDVPLGDIEGAGVYIDIKHLDAWRDRQLILDVDVGIGAGFGLDRGTGRRFITRNRKFSEEELAALDDAFPNA